MFGNYRSVIVGLVFLFVSGLAFGASGQNCGVSAHDREVDAYADVSVLVEAFVVEVDLDALKEAGVSVVGQAPESLSTLKILWCLRDEEMGTIVSGAKVCVKNREQGEVSNDNTIYTKKERVSASGQAKSITYEPHKSGRSFSAQLYVKSDEVIRVEYNYSEIWYDDEEDKMGPANTFKFRLSGTLTVQSGKPLVAGAVQNDDSVKFLIICATVQGGNDPQQESKKADRIIHHNSAN